MRSTIRKLLVGVAAVLALGAAGATSASAGLPEFITHGLPAFPITFKGDLQRTEFSQEFNTWYARYSPITGEITSPNNVANVVITFNKDTPGCWEKEQTITSKLQGKIGYINKTERSVGLLLEPVTEPFASCLWAVGPVALQYRHSIIARLSPGNGFNTSFPLAFQGRGYPEKLEGETTLHHLELYDPQQERSDGPLYLKGSGEINEFKNRYNKSIELEVRR